MKWVLKCVIQSINTGGGDRLLILCVSPGGLAAMLGGVQVGLTVGGIIAAAVVGGIGLLRVVNKCISMLSKQSTLHNTQELKENVMSSPRCVDAASLNEGASVKLDGVDDPKNTSGPSVL